MQQLKPRRGTPNPTYSAKTINNTLTTLAVMLGSAVADGLLRENPCPPPRRRRRPPAADPRGVPGDALPDAEEIPGSWTPATPAYADLAAVLGAGRTSRSPEALALEPRDIDTRVGMIRVSRPIIERHPLAPQGQDAAPRRGRPAPVERSSDGSSGARRAGHPICFPDPEDGDYLDRTTIRKRWHIPALVDAGLDPTLRVHDLRHTAAAAWLIAGGQSLEFVPPAARPLQHPRNPEIRPSGAGWPLAAADLTEAAIWSQEISV